MNAKMKRTNNAEVKIRILVVAKMLNEGRRVTARDIMQRLDLHYGIRVDRKTIYDDIRAINRVLPIDSKTGKYGGYKKCDVSRFERV